MLRFNKNAPSNAHRNFSISIHLMLRFNPEVLRLVKHTDNYFNTSYVKVQQVSETATASKENDFNTSYVKVQLLLLLLLIQIYIYFNTSYVKVQQYRIRNLNQIL